MNTRHKIVATMFCTYFEPLLIHDVLQHKRLKPVLMYCLWACDGYPAIKPFAKQLDENWKRLAPGRALTHYLAHEKDPYLRHVAEQVVASVKKKLGDD